MTVKVVCTEYASIADEMFQERLWIIYSGAFGKALGLCVQEQLCYDRAAFIAALTDTAYRKFVVHVDDEAVGLILCTLDLEKARITYVNPARLIAAYPQYVGRICYYTAIAMDPAFQKTSASKVLMHAAGDAMERDKLLVAFDYSSEKSANLPHLLVAVLKEAQQKNGWESHDVQCTPLGGQVYAVIEFMR